MSVGIVEHSILQYILQYGFAILQYIAVWFLPYSLSDFAINPSIFLPSLSTLFTLSVLVSGVGEKHDGSRSWPFDWDELSGAFPNARACFSELCPVNSDGSTSAFLLSSLTSLCSACIASANVLMFLLICVCFFLCSRCFQRLQTHRVCSVGFQTPPSQTWLFPLERTKGNN